MTPLLKIGAVLTAGTLTFTGLFLSLEQRHEVVKGMVLETPYLEFEQEQQVAPQKPIEVVLPDGDSAIYPTLEDAEIISGIPRESIEWSIKTDSAVSGHIFCQDTMKKYMADSVVLFDQTTQ